MVTAVAVYAASTWIQQPAALQAQVNAQGTQLAVLEQSTADLKTSVVDMRDDLKAIRKDLEHKH